LGKKKRGVKGEKEKELGRREWPLQPRCDWEKKEGRQSPNGVECAKPRAALEDVCRREKNKPRTGFGQKRGFLAGSEDLTFGGGVGGRLKKGKGVKWVLGSGTR